MGWRLAARVCLAVSAVVFAELAASARAQQVSGGQVATGELSPASPSLPADPFRPSNARTADGNPIPAVNFIPAARCAGCHGDIYKEWSESLHRNAGREPFYKESVDLIHESRPIEFSRHCESCHLPVALLSGALKTGSKEPHLLDDEGVTCSVCHSITEARLDGTGSYTIAPPALLLKEGQTVRDASDAEVLADLPAHRRAVMRPLLRTPEFCATCHKSGVPPDLSGYPFLQRGFDVYDEWQQSIFSAETAASAPGPERKDCRGCHMPRVASNDHASKDGRIASHRWLGANTAVPLYYGQADQADKTVGFLRSQVLAVDIFAIENLHTGRRVAPLAGSLGSNQLSVSPGDPLVVEVLAENRGAGHSFPPELRDLYEAWLEFEATDDSGLTFYRSGWLANDGRLDPYAHVYRQLLIDRGGEPLAHHEVWRAVAKECDNRLAAGRRELVLFKFVVPAEAAVGRLRFRAALKYRRFTKDYSDYVLTQQKRSLDIPVVTMAEGIATVGLGETATPAQSGSMAARWNDYGLALLATGNRRSVDAFESAVAMAPSEPSFQINRAVAEMFCSRTSSPEAHARRALALLAPILSRGTPPPRARFWNAVAHALSGDGQSAINELQRLSAAYPRDRELYRHLGNAFVQQNDWPQAEQAFRTITRIDPLDADAFLSLLAVVEQRNGKDLNDLELYYSLISHFPNPSMLGSCDATERPDHE